MIMRSRQKRSVKIIRVYYVFDFDANLLSCKKLYMLKLKDRFDTNVIYFHKNHKNILKINYHENIYVLTWIFNKFSIKIEIASKHRMSL